MKNLKVWLAFLPLLAVACTSESASEATTSHLKTSAKTTTIGPANPANPFDLAGSIHNEILESLDGMDFNPQSAADVANAVDSISSLYPELVTLGGNSSLAARLDEINLLVSCEDPLEQVFTASSLEASARDSFSTFVSSLLLSADSPYEDIRTSIVSYEAFVLDSSEFTSEDKRIILTTTSVVRYSASRKKRKDKDWETSVTSIAATVLGAEECLALGLKMGVTVGLCQNENVSQ
ncbi:hypothetical protein [Flavobacterium pectinovorum]|uniref:Lipoprotein n=1 Tax=Flavobacterium pectinovorum TaxID=29533 RepID=A0AB36P7C2_9FLAO|nr:hypothetical protein [Flavobacterium pectinovorum]OXB07798.1 hypothetical protein B0A72_02725 [Flavobacterium pectinovorum]SHM80852.1 hypothetical protein SAMN05444387_3250 [Flavobacterium pectinovorum]